MRLHKNNKILTKNIIIINKFNRTLSAVVLQYSRRCITYSDQKWANDYRQVNSKVNIPQNKNIYIIYEFIQYNFLVPLHLHLSFDVYSTHKFVNICMCIHHMYICYAFVCMYVCNYKILLMFVHSLHYISIRIVNVLH